MIEYTSIPLLLGFYIIYLSGKGLTNVGLVRSMTFGLLDYITSIFLHTTSLLNYLVGLLVIFHSVSGLGLMIDRKVKNKTIKIVLEIIVIFLVGFVFTLQLTVLEFF